MTFALESAGESTDQEFARLKGLRELAQSQPQLRADIIKLFADGIIEYPTQTAALLEPYRDASGRPGKNLGPLYQEPEALAQFLRARLPKGSACTSTQSAIVRLVLHSMRSRGPVSRVASARTALRISSSSTRPTSRDFASSA